MHLELVCCIIWQGWSWLAVGRMHGQWACELGKVRQCRSGASLFWPCFPNGSPFLVHPSLLVRLRVILISLFISDFSCS